MWYSLVMQTRPSARVASAKEFWNALDKTQTCWFFTGRKQIVFQDRLITPKRVSWELHNKKRLKSKFVIVLNSCGNKLCVNPTHLLIGTQKDVESRKSTPEDFWKHVNKNGPVINKKLGRCWNWTGSVYNPDKDRKGYGQVQYQGKAYPAQRLAWILTNGDIPKGKLACHKCDNVLCVRPSHLFLGTPKDNTTDMMNKGRHKGGLDYIRTKAHRKAISDRMKGQRNMLGRKHSEATKKKIHETRVARGLNKPLSKQHRAAISKSLIGNTRAHDAHVKKSTS